MDTISSVIRPFSAVLAFFAAISLLSACSDPEPPRSSQEILSEIEGTRLTEAEAAVLVDTADLLCAMNQEALKTMLAEVSSERLDYLDWVFGDHCQARQGLYDSVLVESFPEHIKKSDS
jgi:hypothetical protein